MSVWEAIILGLIQGLTEFLPVSSSGHLELAGALLGIQEPDSIRFTMAVHGGTVLSTIVVFRKELGRLIAGFFRFRMNEETKFIINILISLIPIVVVGLFFRKEIEAFFYGNITLVGVMLMVTALLLAFAHRAKPRQLNVTPLKAFIIGLAQAVAVVPGISRSGATISTGLMLGVNKEEVSKFSFLMVLIPIIGANLLEVFDMPADGSGIGAAPLAAGFLTAFVSGTLACRAMIRIVNKGRLVWFAVYCAVVGAATVLFTIF